MRRKISLYIAGQPVDLTDQTFILFNYTMDDLSNPTVVKNSFSQSITLKGTPANNRIFGGMFRPDRQTAYGTTQIGVDFDPMRKIPFAIYNEMNEILEEGYVKMNKIVRKGANIEYQVTLFGGLGSFFYGLMYREDGEKRSLKDMKYTWADGYRTSVATNSPVPYTVASAWNWLRTGELDSAGGNMWNVFNFVPMYNGVPENFDANKAIYRDDSHFGNLPTSYQADGVIYGKAPGNTSFLMTFANAHTEWEIRDLRWYLQRPAISIKALFEAFTQADNNGGFEVVLDPGFFNRDNLYYEYAWLTLPMVKYEDANDIRFLEKVLEASVSPGELLISYAKVFGLCFLYESGQKRVTIMDRATFYRNQDTIDLSDRIDAGSGIEFDPLVADALYYQFGEKVFGTYAGQYLEKYGIPYGAKKVNTGYEFNSESSILTKDITFASGIDVMEFNRMFVWRWLRFESGFKETFVLPAYEKVTVKMYSDPVGENDDRKTVDVPVEAVDTDLAFDNKEYDFGDWLPKVQAHKDNKPEDAAYTLVFFEGMKHVAKEYWLTNDTYEMLSINQDKPCWNLTGTGITLTYLPSFRRDYVDNGKVIASWDWGEPRERAVPGITSAPTAPIYDKYWKRYIADLYDNDTKVMKCKVNLRGLQVNQGLLRCPFWYNGAIWRLNKIVNHSLTTFDDTECEFVKIQDINNYTK